MTQNSDPRDNAIAERVNGILKEELLQPVYATFAAAAKAVAIAIDIYNNNTGKDKVKSWSQGYQNV